VVKTGRQTAGGRRQRLRAAVVAAFLFVAGAAPGADSKIEKRAITSRGKLRTYYAFVPPNISTEHPAPLIVMLHGSGRDGRELLEAWKGLAEKEGIVLAGPDSIESARWASPEDGPLFLRDVVEDVRSKQPIDGRRLYLFGHSAGAVFGLQMAPLESEYFAAAALSAGAIEPAYFNLFDFADRKIPIGIVVGTRDPLFPLSIVRPVAEALKSRGFPIVLNEIAGHDHKYGARSKEINDWAWGFLSPVRLPSDPLYRAYADPP
jgi:poly(3-hydroxybutyrate) depolymerase